jgi:hypothetical protein
MKTFEYAQSLFANKFVEQSVVDANATKWLSAVKVLGEKWLLAKKVERKVK